MIIIIIIIIIINSIEMIIVFAHYSEIISYNVYVADMEFNCRNVHVY